LVIGDAKTSVTKIIMIPNFHLVSFMAFINNKNAFIDKKFFNKVYTKKNCTSNCVKILLGYIEKFGMIIELHLF
jgi:hypothetical protein